METYSDLRNAADKDGCLLKTNMATLKTIKGAGRLGKNVRDAISRELEGHGLGHLPAELPPNQEDEVRLYVLGSPVADVIRAVLDPSDKGDEALRTVGTDSAAEILQQVRELVCG